MLDEPTNDLDLETLDLLQELLADYPGTVLLVSHDRDFLDRVVTSVIAAEGDGRWIEYAGGYSDMLAQRRRAAGSCALRGPSPPRQRAAQAPAAGRTRQLSFKEKHALETLPTRIEAVQADIARLQSELADPDLYVRDPARVRQRLGRARCRAGGRSPKRRSSGWSSRCCARSWKADLPRQAQEEAREATRTFAAIGPASPSSST